MAKVTEIYERYKIMPSLQLHQLRVAAVSKQICDNLQKPVDADTILKACLLHDMGNIIKFSLDTFPQFLEPHGREYWQKVKDDFIKKYSTDSHIASTKIAQELGSSQKVIGCIDAIMFGYAANNEKSENMDHKICAYSDMRVSPHGIVSLEERMAEGHRRYQDREDSYLGSGQYDMLADALRSIEKQIFFRADIKPESITEESSAPIIKQLKSYEI